MVVSALILDKQLVNLHFLALLVQPLGMHLGQPLGMDLGEDMLLLVVDKVLVLASHSHSKLLEQEDKRLAERN